MCHHHQIASSSLALKDFIAPTAGLIGALITVFTGYKFLSLQARKNRRLKLIEDLRKEVANFYSLITTDYIVKQLEGMELISSIAATQLLIDENDPDQKLLIEKMSELNNERVKGILAKPDYEGLMKLARKIISDQTKKL